MRESFLFLRERDRERDVKLPLRGKARAIIFGDWLPFLIPPPPPPPSTRKTFLFVVEICTTFFSTLIIPICFSNFCSVFLHNRNKNKLKKSFAIFSCITKMDIHCIFLLTSLYLQFGGIASFDISRK